MLSEDQIISHIDNIKNIINSINKENTPKNQDDFYDHNYYFSNASRAITFLEEANTFLDRINKKYVSF